MTTSPPIDRDLTKCATIFLISFNAWLADARARVQHVDIVVTEARRTQARQAWLYAQGREYPYDKAPAVTWTLDSRHRWGLAADIAMIRRETKQAIWEVSSWQWLYRICPPEQYGLRHLAPREFVHLEYRYATEAIAEADALRLQQT